MLSVMMGKYTASLPNDDIYDWLGYHLSDMQKSFDSCT
jgi:hypothetical protein